MPVKVYAWRRSLAPSLPLRDAPSLPIDAVLAPLHAALADRGAAVLVAAPGAGKTTRVPLALLTAAWRGEGRILVLEPRRLAARAAAEQMARLLGEPVGRTVGYRVRLESRVSAATRIEVITEGIFTRLVQEDPSLEGVAAVLFDEFHERHLPSDLGLALALESRGVLRPDLRILVMSATLEPAPVAALLGDAVPAPVVVSEGREHPVSTSWRPARDGVPMPRHTAQAVRAALAAHPGDVLVFLPGLAELNRTRDALEEDALDARVELLHGSLSLEDQDRVLRPRIPGRRVILSTAIAESSVTLDGVRVVVDAGLARVPRYDPRSGMSRLATVRVSRASADQRRGRAGRSAPGHCIRLWDEGQHASLPARATPEVLETDLTALALELACAGHADAAALRWLDAPPAGALTQGRALLTDLGALDAQGRVTAHGRAMAALGIAPRLAHLALRGAALGMATLACEVAALLAERDILRRDAAEHDADLVTRLDALRGRDRGRADPTRAQRVRQEAQALRRALPREAHDREEDLAALGTLVALAYPDRIAQRRPGEAPRYLLRNGRGARLATAQPLGNSPFLAVADLDGDPAESRIWLAAPLDEASLLASTAGQVSAERRIWWDDSTASVRATERERLGAIVLRERPLRDIPPEAIAAAVLDAVRAKGIAALPWTEADTALRTRLAFAHAALGAPFPDVSDDALLATLDAWLRPALGEARRWSDLARIGLGKALLAPLPWAQRERLDRIAPTHVAVPSGSRIRVDYGDPLHPVLAVKLQECFGLTETPRLAEGRVPLTMHLLSPAGRPVQVTQDLASFWRSGYFEVRKDLKGRYPRHPWPDDPLAAPPTRRVKPRGS
ncbi:MAG: ATP-dependent helicase HrpB [Gemmatimonadaceae bacterium]|nr:ATP-dependent helicase HrpB [Gemmatimonadaceae bacterium]MCW5826208.1 ATP-dependent helicase HrpB [Gemmatimonadaceae bacterium]